MYVPAVTVSAIMATESTDGEIVKLSPEVMSTTASSIYIRWAWEGLGPVYVRGFRVQYHRIASSYAQHSGLLSPTVNSYTVSNLVADTYYKVCVTMYRNDTSIPLKECLEASTASWHIPVSIGSSIGAVLALSIIVFIVLLARCPNLVRQPRTVAAESSKYDSMSSHYPDDRYEMSDSTTHCHDNDRDDDVFSQNSEGDSLTDSKTAARHVHLHHHPQHSPQSLADRLCNGNRMTNGVGKHTRIPVPLGKVGRTFSLTERRHQPNHPHKMRQARLAHLHANFHSIQSEPGSIHERPPPRVSITDDPVSTTSADFPRVTHNTPTSINSGKGTAAQTPDRNPVGSKEKSRLLYTIESASSTSEPTMLDATDSVRKMKPPALKNLPKTIHMSIDSDTLV